MPKRRDGEPDLKAKDSHSQQIKRRKKPNAAFHDSRIPSVAPLKSKIHDLKRALQHNERMPADVRIEKERALAGYKQDLESAEKEKQKQVMIGRYHMVRFFERQKAGRLVKKAQKAVEASSPDQPEYQQLQQDLHAAEVDVCYAIHYPLTEKYISLYAGKDEKNNSKGNETSTKGKPEMWEIVRQSMGKGTLDALREGTSATLANAEVVGIGTKAPRPKHEGRLGNRGSKSIRIEELDEESDGGFFEENKDGGDVTLP